MTATESLRRTFGDVPTARVATIDEDGWPRVSPVWFVWREDAMYLSTRIGSATWRNAERDPRVSVVIERGRDWLDLAGVRARGRAEVLQAEHPDLREAMSAWHDKYRGLLAGQGFERFAETVPALGFLRLEADRIEDWDHARRR